MGDTLLKGSFSGEQTTDAISVRRADLIIKGNDAAFIVEMEVVPGEWAPVFISGELEATGMVATYEFNDYHSMRIRFTAGDGFYHFGLTGNAARGD